MADRTIRDLITEDTAPKASASPSLDLGRIKGNVAKMIDQGAQDSDIEAYVAAEGATPEAIRAYNPAPMDIAQEIASPVRGFNTGFDTLYNLPNQAINLAGRGVNYASESLGYGRPLPEQLIEPARIATRDWTFGAIPGHEEAQNYEPQSFLGKTGQAIGEVAGSSVLPEAAMISKAGALLPKVGDVTTQALRTASAARGAPEVAAPALTRIAEAGPGKALQSAIAPTIGAGTGIELAREADLGPIGEMAAGLAGGFLAPNVVNLGARTLSTAKGVKAYAGRQMARAGDYQLAADQDTVDALLKAGVNPEDLFQEFAPAPSGQLKGRGVTGEQLADAVGRVKGGERVESVAADLKVSPETLGKYVRHLDSNPTPRNVADVVQDRTNVGQASPVLRLGRTAFGIADEGEVLGKLTARQNDQYGRMVNIFRKAAKNRDYDQTIADLDETLGKKSQEAYGLAKQNEKPFDLRQAIDAQRQVAFESAGDIKTQLEKAIDLFYEPLMTDQGTVRKLGQPISDVGRYKGAREALDYMIEQSKNAQGKATTLTRKLTGLRKAVNGVVRQANPDLAAADDQFSGAKATQELLKRGEQLTTQLGSKTDDFFKDYGKLNSEQREIIRLAFLRKLENQAARPQEGAAIANQFRSQQVQQTIRRLFGPEQAKKGMSPEELKALGKRNIENVKLGDELIKSGRREATTTNTLNAITNRGNTQTAPWLRDMQQAEEGAGLVGDVVTGNAVGVLRRTGRKLAAQIGEKTSKAILDNLANTNPEEVIPKIRRWVQLAKTAEERQAYVIAMREYARAARQAGVDIGTVTAPTIQREHRP